jgi:hypothetical protein
MSDTRIYRCTLSDCKNNTMFPFNRDPRKRWIIDLELLDSDGCMACDAEVLGRMSTSEQMVTDLTHTCVSRKVSLCPSCAKELLNLTEDSYARLERAEKIAQGKLPVTELVQ